MTKIPVFPGTGHPGASGKNQRFSGKLFNNFGEILLNLCLQIKLMHISEITDLTTFMMSFRIGFKAGVMSIKDLFQWLNRISKR